MRHATHRELKILKAELIRQDFERYLSSEDFRVLLIEKDFDEYFKNALNEIKSTSRERRIDSFIMIINDILYAYINEDPESNSRLIIYSNFFYVLEFFLIGYYSSKKEPFEYAKMIECLKKITILNSKDVEIIENKIREIESNIKKVIPDNLANLEELKSNQLKIEYAVITALEDDEMEKVLPFINKISEADNTKNYIEIGELKTDTNKRIVYASQHNTGMVDASILASELICRFNPKYLIMVGVLGGKPKETHIGDVIIATKVFEVDRGKITDTGFKKESSVAQITNREIKKISRAKKLIEAHLNNIDETRDSTIKLHFGPIACVNQVIDLDGFFDEEVSSLDRKAVALEMESFAVVRACELLNDGKTVPIIIKSVMDNTSGKDDNAKPYAAWTSAKTLKYILENNII